jgi:hypothetical protein
VAITSIFEIPDGRSATIGPNWARTFGRTFQVETDSAAVGPVAIAHALPFAIGTPYQTSTEKYPGAYIQNFRFDAASSDGRTWRVGVEYGPFDASQFPENPFDRRPDYEWSFVEFQRIVDEDIHGEAIVNTAKEYFDPPVEIDDSRPVCTVTRNEDHFNIHLAKEFRDSINESEFWGWPAYTVKCKSISAKLALDPLVGWYWVVTYILEFNPDQWGREILSQGLRQLNTAGTAYAPILINGSQTTSPVPLDEKGHALPPDGDPVFLTFDVYREMDFSILNLPEPPFQEPPSSS